MMMTSHSSPIFAKAIAVVSAVVLCLWSSDNLRSSSRRSRADNGHFLDHSRPRGIIMATSETNEAAQNDDACWPPTNMPPHLLNGDRTRLAQCVKYSHIVRALRDEYTVGEEEEISWEILEIGLKKMAQWERNGFGPSPGGPLANTTYRQLSNAVEADYYAYERGSSPWHLLISSLEVMYKMEYADNNGRPIQISESYPYLYISNAGVAYNLTALKETGITHIITATPGVDEVFPHEFKYLNIKDVKDDSDDPQMTLGRYFEQTAAFIDDARTVGGKVLVHCWDGKSRSATVLVAYLISHQNKTRDAALAMIKTVRPIAKPNDQYMSELEGLERERRETKADCNDPLPADARIIDEYGSLADGVEYSTIRRFIVNKYDDSIASQQTNASSWKQFKWGFKELLRDETITGSNGLRLLSQVSYLQLENAVLAKYAASNTKKTPDKWNQLMTSLWVMRKVETDGEPVPIQEEDQRWQPRLYIGGAGAAYNLKALQDVGISHIISVAPRIGKIFEDEFEYLYISDVADREGSGSQLLPYFDRTFDFIDGAIRGGGKVLVHGWNGKSRCVAVVEAYLMKRKSIGHRAALKMIQTTRSKADPKNFVGALRQYEKETK